MEHDESKNWRDLFANGKTQHLYTIRYTLPKQDIQMFVNELETIKEGMVEEALGYSDMREAKEVIAHIMSM